MKMTRILPTDRNGEIYYGPKNVAQAKSAIRDMDAEPAHVVAAMRKAGYDRAANRIAREFCE